MNPNDLREILYQNYPFVVDTISEAPRQFVAETFVVQTNENVKYFVKVTEKSTFVEEIMQGLPTLYELHELGINFINYPIKTTNNAFYVKDLNRLIVVYNFISAKQTYEYDFETFGGLTAKIHKMTPHIKTRPPVESFEYAYKKTFENALGLNSKSDALNELIAFHSEMLKKYYEIFQNICSMQQRTKHQNLVLTNGDAPGNVLAKSKTDLFITDWDDLKLASPERDLWFLDHEKEFMDGYRKVFPDFKMNDQNKYFCVLNYFFNSCVHYINEIEPGSDVNRYLESDYSIKHLTGLSGFLDLNKSWISKYLVKIDDFARSV